MSIKNRVKRIERRMEELYPPHSASMTAEELVMEGARLFIGAHPEWHDLQPGDVPPGEYAQAQWHLACARGDREAADHWRMQMPPLPPLSIEELIAEAEASIR